MFGKKKKESDKEGVLFNVSGVDLYISDLKSNSLNSKMVIYKGVKFKIYMETGISYAYFKVNGETTPYHVYIEQMHNLKEFAPTALKAINSYLNKKAIEKQFKNWDGKL